MVSSCWFVDKAYTTGVMMGEGEAKTLRMEIGLRHENLRASASFTYRSLLTLLGLFWHYYSLIVIGLRHEHLRASASFTYRCSASRTEPTKH
jgi:hypothetical protein